MATIQFHCKLLKPKTTTSCNDDDDDVDVDDYDNNDNNYINTPLLSLNNDNNN